MKKLSRRLQFLLLLLLVCGAAFLLNRTSYHEQMRSVGFSQNGWALRIEPDGSGKVSYGSNGFDFDQFPSGTFTTNDIYATLRAFEKLGASETNFTPIHYRLDNSPEKSMSNEKGNLYIAKLFETALENCQPKHLERFEEILESHPFLGKPPLHSWPSENHKFSISKIPKE